MNEQLLRSAANEFGTPLYLFDLDIIRQTVRAFREALGDRAGLCYAIKANPFVIREFAQVADRIEVCSMGEFRICKKMDIAPEKLLISGVLKKRNEIREILDTFGSRCMYTAESENQFRLLKEWAEEHRTTLRIHLRLTAGSQFGMDSEILENIIRTEKENPFIELLGIHYFSGTQKKNVGKIRKELEMLDSYFEHLQCDLNFCPTELEYGPGLAVSYFEDQEDTSEEDRVELGRILDSMNWKGTTILEMGRALAAYCGTYLTTVEDVKCSRGRHYCITDGGLHQLNYDGQIRGMYVPAVSILKKHVPITAVSEASAAESTDPEQISTPTAELESAIPKNEHWTVCGSLCTTNDILIQKLCVDALEIGDIIAFDQVGAYSVTEGMALFLSHELPTVISFEETSGFKVIRPRLESFELNSSNIK